MNKIDPIEPTEVLLLQAPLLSDWSIDTATNEVCGGVGLHPETEILDSLPIEVSETAMEAMTEPALEAAVPTGEEMRVNLPVALCDEKLFEEIRRIPKKMGFKIGEVADMLGIKQYVLRYWETEFEVLRPKKALNKQRYYTRRDVENAFLIRKLLHRDRFSIEGARTAMKSLKEFVKKETTKEKLQTHNRADLLMLQERVLNLRAGLSRARRLFI